MSITQGIVYAVCAYLWANAGVYLWRAYGARVRVCVGVSLAVLDHLWRGSKPDQARFNKRQLPNSMVPSVLNTNTEGCRDAEESVVRYGA